MKPFKSINKPVVLIGGLILFGLGLRIARHFGWLALPPNFSPISGLALFSGTLLPRRYAFIVPLGAMLASDLVIGFYSLPVMLAVYLSFAGSNLLGLWLKQRVSWRRIAGAAIIGSILFFLTTNAAVWLWQNMYPHNLFGLGQAYLVGLPFFRNTVMGDLIYTGVFFGIYQAVMVYWKQRAIVTSA